MRIDVRAKITNILGEQCFINELGYFHIDSRYMGQDWYTWAIHSLKCFPQNIRPCLSCLFVTGDTLYRYMKSDNQVRQVRKKKCTGRSWTPSINR